MLEVRTTQARSLAFRRAYFRFFEVRTVKHGPLAWPDQRSFVFLRFARCHEAGPPAFQSAYFRGFSRFAWLSIVAPSRSKARFFVVFGLRTVEARPLAFRRAYFPSEFGGSRGDPGWVSAGIPESVFSKGG